MRMSARTLALKDEQTYIYVLLYYAAALMKTSSPSGQVCVCVCVWHLMDDRTERTTSAFNSSFIGHQEALVRPTDPLSGRTLGNCYRNWRRVGRRRRRME